MSWPAAGLAHSSSVSDTRDQKVHGSNLDMSKAVFSRDMAGSARHLHFFLLLPNEVLLASEEFT